MSDKRDYSDIINMPHHVSEKHARMTMHGRAGQFASFAALTGYSEAVDETTEKAGKAYEAAGLFYCSDEIDDYI